MTNFDVMNKSKILTLLNEKIKNGESISYQSAVDYVNKEFNINIGLRSMQRYFIDLQDLNRLIKFENINRVRHYLIPKNQYLINSYSNSIIDTNLLISLKILKSQLHFFKDTDIEEDVNNLIDSINSKIPESEFYSDNSLYLDHNYGKFSPDKKYSNTVSSVIDFILKKEWIKVTYKTDNKTSTFITLLQKLFHFEGSLYVACFSHKDNSVFPISLQFIDKIEKLTPNEKKPLSNIKIIDFDYEKFKEFRFGVWSGKDNESKEIKLKVNNNIKRYFENREFHPKQEISYNDDNELIIKFNLPFSPELEKWIIGWCGDVIVLEPEELKDRIRDKASKILESLKN